MKTWHALAVGLFVGLWISVASATVGTTQPAVLNNTEYVPVLDAGIIGCAGPVQSYAAPGACGAQNLNAGAKTCVGPGANIYWSQDPNGNLSAGLGLAYTPSATPFTLDSVYVNNVPQAFTYGGGTLPAHAFTVQAIRFHVRTAGSAGSTVAEFRASDGTNNCNCVYACNQTTGSKRVACLGDAGTGCVFPVSAAMTYAFTAVGDCAATSADITGNISVEGAWQ